VSLERHILVIEDDADVRAALAEALADAGLLVHLAEDGVEGLDLLNGGPSPCVIVLDLRMPRLGGLEFLHAMRADPRFEHIPVISMTAGTEAPGRGEVLAHLDKPFDLDALLEIVLSLTEANAA
jgi:CheY-like chemotaxis protein